MESEVDTLRKQLQEEQRLRKDAQQREQEAERLREEAQRREREAERLCAEDRHRYEQRTGKTTLPEFLDACYTHLCLGLTIQPDSTQSTQGNAANAENKPCPDQILLWPGFDTKQAHIWETLIVSEFVLKQHFMSLYTLEESGEAVH